MSKRLWVPRTSSRGSTRLAHLTGSPHPAGLLVRFLRIDFFQAIFKTSRTMPRTLW
ncbi:hypothetical protein N657DRAFT_639841 [Parathielavia appendiculata]|uniref:Uncharacterized protein n=1 Tax=Parathielavia appendiculata TaxID=2587402 RepID=A0AAN6UA96_9PEZI|nr:hypothetical protein N657DRAFT_639841 [Parathielavia appendiculata]